MAKRKVSAKQKKAQGRGCAVLIVGAVILGVIGALNGDDDESGSAAVPTRVAIVEITSPPSPLSVPERGSEIPPPAQEGEQDAPSATITETVTRTATATITVTVDAPTFTLPAFTPQAGVGITLEAARTYYAGPNGANLRSEPARAGLVVIQLNSGEPITVTAMVNGESIDAGNAIWYVTEYNGRAAYVYSNVVVLNAPSVVQPAAVQPPAAQNQSPDPVSPFGCNGMDDLNCSNFNAIGQNANAHLAVCGDEDRLDSDGDGRACEQN